MRSPSIRTIAGSSGGPPRPSISRAALTTIDCEAAAEGGAIAIPDRRTATRAQRRVIDSSEAESSATASHHSHLRASVGSTTPARRVGAQHATSVTAMNTTLAATIVTGSVGAMSNKNDCRTRDRISAPTTPATMPPETSRKPHAASPGHSSRRFGACAARRRPASRSTFSLQRSSVSNCSIMSVIIQTAS